MIDDSASRRKDAWSLEQDQAIVDLRSRQFPWKEVAEQVSRTVESCCARYRALVGPADRARFRSSKRWSDQSEATLQRLLAEKKTVKEIAIEMHMPRTCIYSKVNYIQSRSVHTELSSRVSVPPSCLADRERRLAAPQTITGVLCGDPPEGFSALDRRATA